MKKLFSLILILSAFFAFMPLSATAAVNKKINANIKTKRVPAGTVIDLKFLDNVSSSSAALGDQFDLMVAENVKVNNDN